MRPLPFRLLLFLILPVTCLLYVSGAVFQHVEARPTWILALDPSIVNAVSTAACAPACDLANPVDLLAVADADGDGDGDVEPDDFIAVDLDGDQLVAESGELWIVAFVSNDGYVHFDADEGVFGENGSSQVECDSGFTDEDCDNDGIWGDGAVVVTLTGGGSPDLGAAIITVSQTGIDVEMDYTVVAGATGSISGAVVDAGDGPLGGCHMTAHPLSGGGDTYSYTGVAGQYSLRYLSAGTYAVRAWCSGYVSEYYDDVFAAEDADPVAVVEGENTPDIDFALDAEPVVTPTPSPWDAAVIATIPLGWGGHGPTAIAVNAATHRAYVANGDSDRVLVIDTTSDSVVASIETGEGPSGTAVNPMNGRVYVTNRFSDTLSVIDSATNSVLAQVSAGAEPAGVAVDIAGNRIYVANNEDDSVTVVNGVTNTLITTVPVGGSPEGVAIDPASGRVYVCNSGSSSVSIISGTSVTKTVPVGPRPMNAGIDWNMGRVFVTNSGNDGLGNTVSVIDTGTDLVTDTIVVGSEPVGTAVEQSGGRVYVTNRNGDSVSVIDETSMTMIATIPVESEPSSIAVIPGAGRAYVTNEWSNSVSVIDTSANENVGRIVLGVGASRVAVNPVTNRVYVSNPSANTVSVIDGAANTVTSTVNVGLHPSGLAVNPNTNRIFVANSGDDSVSVLDGVTDAVIASIPATEGAFGVAVNPETNLVYVDSFSGVWVIDGATDETIASITVPDIYPGTVVADPVTNRIYVGCARSSGVAIIDGDSNEFVGSVPLAYEVRFLAVNPSTNRVYAHSNSGFPYFRSRLYVIDGNSGELVATITDIWTGGLAANPTTNHVFFTTYRSSYVASVLDGATNTVIGDVFVGRYPTGVAANPATGQVYVANSGDDTVTVISDPLPPVGGAAESPDLTGATQGSSNAFVLLAVLVTGAIAALAAVGWYARRRTLCRGRED
jgi:YVTN family beta-propeller protein